MFWGVSSSVTSNTCLTLQDSLVMQYIILYLFLEVKDLKSHLFCPKHIQRVELDTILLTQI